MRDLSNPLAQRLATRSASTCGTHLRNRMLDDVGCWRRSPHCGHDRSLRHPPPPDARPTCARLVATSAAPPPPSPVRPPALTRTCFRGVLPPLSAAAAQAAHSLLLLHRSPPSHCPAGGCLPRRHSDSQAKPADNDGKRGVTPTRHPTRHPLPPRRKPPIPYAERERGACLGCVAGRQRRRRRRRCLVRRRGTARRRRRVDWWVPLRL